MGKRVGMDVLSRLTQRANAVLMKSVEKVRELKIQYIDTEHVLWALLQDSNIYQLISDCKVAPADLKTALEKGFKKGNFTGRPFPRIRIYLSGTYTLGFIPGG